MQIHERNPIGLVFHRRSTVRVSFDVKSSIRRAVRRGAGNGITDTHRRPTVDVNRRREKIARSTVTIRVQRGGIIEGELVRDFITSR